MQSTLLSRFMKRPVYLDVTSYVPRLSPGWMIVFISHFLSLFCCCHPYTREKNSSRTFTTFTFGTWVCLFVLS